MDNTKPFAVVTGGSNGIGLELAKEFSRNGFDVLLTAEPDGRLEAAAAEVQALGAAVSTVAADLTKPGGVETLYNFIKAGGRPVDAADYFGGSPPQDG